MRTRRPHPHSGLTPGPAYIGLRPLDPELQARHARVQEVLRNTLTVREAAERYGMEAEVMRTMLADREAVEGYGAKRYWIRDVERVVARMRGST